MKKILLITLSVLVISLVVGYALSSDIPKANLDEVWTYITKTSPYKEWKFFDDHKEMQPGKAPHGPFHKVYVNEVGYNAEAAPFPAGTLIVKESYNTEKKFVAITLMYKVKDYNPSVGDWYWARFSPDGKGGPDGKVQMCIGCHQAKKANDFVFVHQF